MNYVIIGNSAAAIGGVEGIRKFDKTGKITVISGEKHHVYSRPLISYLIYGKTNEEKMKYRRDSFYEDNQVNLIYGTCIKIESDSILLENGDKIGYDKLLVATGSRPFIPPVKGLDTVKNKTTFMTLDEVYVLQDMLFPESRVLVMGAGLIGLKAAEGINDKVKKITVVDLADRILPSILDADGGEIMKQHIEKQGISFLLNDCVSEFQGNTAVMASGKTVEFDILIIAAGVRPNVSLVQEAGGQINRGILTDACQKTTLDNIYAAGDCTESIDITTGESKILALLPNAYAQGQCAGINMAGGVMEYSKAVPLNAIGFFGLQTVTSGSYAGECKTISDEKSIKRFFSKDNVLKGYILIGDIGKASTYLTFIKEETPLDTVDPVLFS